MPFLAPSQQCQSTEGKQKQCLHTCAGAFVRALQIIPVREGSLQLTATDLCLPALSSAASTVIISDMGSIVVDVVDKVQQNNEIAAHVQVLDYGQRPILRDHFTLMDLRLVAASDIISVR